MGPAVCWSDQFYPVRRELSSSPVASANGPVYPSFVPKTDRDGNDIAGVRLPDVTVPLATYTGWALRRGAHANDGCEAAGQYIPFAKTKADRLASGDPRPSIEERYPTFAEYQSEVHRAIDGLVKDRLLLCEDAGEQLARLIQAGLNAGVPRRAGRGKSRRSRRSAKTTRENEDSALHRKLIVKAALISCNIPPRARRTVSRDVKKTRARPAFKAIADLGTPCASAL